ncbi:hypothetical protein APHAL10511_006354 [Amanita phalloides]|nr:hypothetical protein APHAL10511_006354 [Amanita phalloides]
MHPTHPGLSQLSLLIEHNIHLFATGSNDIQNAALLATQYLFGQALRSEADSIPYINQLLSSLNQSEAPQTRSKTKRKRSPSPLPDVQTQFQTTPLTALFADGMNEDQVWAQLDIRTKNMCDVLNSVLEEDGPLESVDGEDGSENDSEGDSAFASEAFGGEYLSWSDEDEEEESENSEDEHAETIAELHDSSSDEGSEPFKFRKKRPKHGGHPDLDDEFFDLAAFKAEIEAAEARSSTRGRLDGSDEESEDEDIDIFAPITEDQPIEDNESHELYYNDFFVPPKRQRISTPIPSGKVRFHEEVRVKKIKAEGKGQPVSTLYDEDMKDELEDMEDDFEESECVDNSSSIDGEVNSEDGSGATDDEEGGLETINRFKDDLFAEEEGDANGNMTPHEKRMVVLSKQIAEFEAQNIATKDWVLMGEASSKSRPQNSLLEEDLEFERLIKPVPVVTQETVQALEDRIKARILEGRFDDVVRIRPHDDKPFLPSRLLELKDTKSAQSLAQIYEDEYLAAQGNGVPVNDRDTNLQTEHEEIEKLWESICYKLDALCNAHFVPKQPKAVISTVSNVPVATLESALPTTKSAKRMLAPEELLAPINSDLRARSEMTPSEKQALRNKKKKAAKKSRDRLQKSVDKFAKVRDSRKQKQAALESVVKRGKGVTVVGKKSKELPRRKGNNIALLYTTMPLFKRKEQVMIPPVPESADNSSSRQGNKSHASTYVPSRDGDPYNFPSNRSTLEDAKGFRDKYNRNNDVGDVYSRGGANIDRDRGELLSGYKPREGVQNQFVDGPNDSGEGNDDDIEGIKTQTRFIKQDSVNTTRNALRLAREAEETARNTLTKLGVQSEKLANTERHLDISKGHSERAGDKTDELKQLNRSIFRPVIAFNKEAKRLAQEEQIRSRYEEERLERERAMVDIRETQNRLGRAATYGRTDDEGINRGPRTAQQLAAKKEQRMRYQFEGGASDDELEDQIDENLDEISDATKRLKALAMGMGQELDSQINRIGRIDDKTLNLDTKVLMNTERLKRIK